MLSNIRAIYNNTNKYSQAETLEINFESSDCGYASQKKDTTKGYFYTPCIKHIIIIFILSDSIGITTNTNMTKAHCHIFTNRHE